MYHLAAITDSIVNWATDVIGSAGAWGVFILMTLESALIPIPSEATMLFAGFNVSEGKLTLLEIVAAGVIGNLAGSWIAYGIGYFGRIELIERHGKWLHVSTSQIARADRWFERYGSATVFFSRMLPIIRTFISLPAGVARMPFMRFTVLTTLGCIPWVLMLALIGKGVGDRWGEWRDKLHYLDYTVLVGLLAIAVYYLIRRRRNRNSAIDAEAAAGIDLNEAEAGLQALTAVLATIDPGGPSRTAIAAGHYATVLAIDDRTGVAVGTDGVGTKIVLAQQMRKFDTVGIDCIAMNVNDVICVGAAPIAVLDYLAVEEASPDLLEQIGIGLKEGAELAGVEIPGGELAQVRELLCGHPSPYGFDLVGTCVGTVPLDRIITGSSITAGDVIIGLPSSGVHSNGLTLARKALLERGGLQLDQRPDGLERSIGEELLEPTEIYVRAIKELLGLGVDVHGLAHITGGGISNLLRLNDRVGYEITDPLPVPPIFGLIQELGAIGEEEMYEVFNMGMGFCCIVSPGSAERAVELLKHSYDKARSVGRVTGLAGKVTR